MAGFRNRRFTIYDMMEAHGVFEANPANQQSRDQSSGESLYKGPVQFPKIFYHPKGEKKITVPGELVQTLLGPKLLGQQKELITAIAKTPEEAAALVADGWHDHPAKAMTAAGEEAPPMNANDRMAELEAELTLLRAEKAGNTAGALPRAEATV